MCAPYKFGTSSISSVVTGGDVRAVFACRSPESEPAEITRIISLSLSLSPLHPLSLSLSRFNMHAYTCTYIHIYVLLRLSHLMKVESAAGLEGLGEELAVDAVLVSSTSIIVHTDDGHHHRPPAPAPLCDTRYPARRMAESEKGGLTTSDELRQRDRDDHDDGDEPRGGRPTTMRGPTAVTPSSRFPRRKEGRGTGRAETTRVEGARAVRWGMIGDWFHARRPRARAYG